MIEQLTRWIVNFIEPSPDEGEPMPDDMQRNNLARDVMGWLVMGIGFLVVAIGTAAENHELRQSIWVLDSNLRDVKDRLKIGTPAENMLLARLRTIEERVRRPRFSRHRDNCPQCRGDSPSEEGGPSPLCEKGFRLYQRDVADEVHEEDE